ncbi:o-succinylbenzoate--CoA ligase [Atlantibacter hermannii]|uniref:o-succinylbenzoate--CoA ligase n=1 Tax=Atlantibacter hermannii TaxID=565 RepID=UPI0019330EF8|nr:o-succinylbenzoate--CoA ligase [Atlantibacter hermannii]MBL7673464.1 o-succinylbenzoate--CoA ligase [Atlantibacter hermannii]
MIFAHFPWQHWAQRRGDATALTLNDQPLSWRQLCQQVDALAAGLAQQGVSEGAGVALRGRNGPQMVLAWLALMQCGARVLPLNPQLPSALLEELLPELNMDYALELGCDALLSRFPALALTPGEPAETGDWQPNRIVSMTLTSGSTGLPKAAAHSAQAHLASAQGVLAAIPFHPQDCWLLSLPLFHVSGQGILWRWLLAGAQLAVRESLPLHQALSGCTHASLVPTQLWRLLNDHHPLTLKAVLLGGAAIPVELTDMATERGIACWCGYGMTETASTVCAKRADGKPDVGTALPGREIKIVDGEVWLRSASLASGYWRNGLLRPLLNQDGWFATRDRGEIHDGRLTVLGRIDNLFFSAGEGIQPEEVERVIATHPHISQVFVVPLADSEFGHRPVAIVEGEADLDLTSLAGWVSDKLARFQQPVRWLALPAHFKNGGIKISRRALQQWVNSDRG